MTQLAQDQYGYKRKRSKKSPRPLLITVLCLLLFAWGLWEIVYSFTGNTAAYTSGFNTLYPAVNALMMVFSFVAVSGVWSMEKWGPVSFVIVLTLKLLVDLFFEQFNWWYMLGYAAGVIFLLAMSKMRNSE
jgi:hypothetical protein